MEEDESEGRDSLQAILSIKAPSTILKHVGPVRTFCEWLVKTNSHPPFGEKSVWSFVPCVSKMPRTAATTLDTCLKAIKWSYHSLGLRVQLKVFQSCRVAVINGLRLFPGPGPHLREAAPEGPALPQCRARNAPSPIGLLSSAGAERHGGERLALEALRSGMRLPPFARRCVAWAGVP